MMLVIMTLWQQVTDCSVFIFLQSLLEGGASAVDIVRRALVWRRAALSKYGLNEKEPSMSEIEYKTE